MGLSMKSPLPGSEENAALISWDRVVSFYAGMRGIVKRTMKSP